MAEPLSAGDKLAIHEIIYRYSLLADEADFVALGQLLSEADIYLQGRLLVSRDAAAVREKFAAAVRPEGAGHRHVTTNVIVDAISVDTATATSYFAFSETLPGETPRIMQCGIYRDTFERRGGTWLFTERRIVSDGKPQA